MTDLNRCSFATQVPDLVADAPRGGPVLGLVIHCTGRSCVTSAIARGIPPIEHALAFYQRAEFSAHYVIDHDGSLYQLTADDRRVQHVGLTAADRAAYLDGSWERRVSPAAARRWCARWPGVKSPAHLYPSTAPNSDFVGVELLPLAKPLNGGRWYADAQHEAAGRLAADLAERHAWPTIWLHGWSRHPAWYGRATPALVTHEDLSPLTRWDAGGGWDPGALRAAPRLDWGAVLVAAGSHSLLFA